MRFPDFPKAVSLLSTRIFSLRYQAIALSCFLAIILLANLIVRSLRKIVVIGSPTCLYWPISEFYPLGINLTKVVVAASVLGLFYFLLRYRSMLMRNLAGVICVSFCLVALTNFIQGVRVGFVVPVCGPFPGTGQYYDQALRIIDPLYFISNFERLQLGLFQHSVTHPPGGTLLWFWLIKIFTRPLWISLVMAIASVSLSCFFLYALLRLRLDRELSLFSVFLFSLIPAVQVYYLTSMEALIAGLLLGAIYFFLRFESWLSAAGAMILVFLASCLTFLFAFILPLFFAYEIIKKNSAFKSLLICAGLIIMHIFIFIALRYNYAHSFWIASTYENLGRAAGTFNFAEYCISRISGMLEIFIFFGPFLTVLFFRAMRMERSEFKLISGLGVFILFTMFIAGFFRNCETARIAVFIYPYLLLPISVYLEKIRISLKEKVQISALVFTQAVGMQLAGSYFW